MSRLECDRYECTALACRWLLLEAPDDGSKSFTKWCRRHFDEWKVRPKDFDVTTTREFTYEEWQVAKILLE